MSVLFSILGIFGVHLGKIHRYLRFSTIHTFQGTKLRQLYLSFRCINLLMRLLLGILKLFFRQYIRDTNTFSNLMTMISVSLRKKSWTRVQFCRYIMDELFLGLWPPRVQLLAFCLTQGMTHSSA